MAICGALAVVLGMALTGVFAGDAYAIYGLPDPGALVRYGLPMMRVLADLGAVVCIGSLWLAAFAIPPGRSGMIAADGYAAVRAAGWSAAVWCVAALWVAPLLAADASGRPLLELADPVVLFGLIDAIEQAKSWLLTAGVALVVAIGCRVALSWTSAAVLLLCAVAGLLPVVATGHSASGAHDLATSSLLYHLVGASLWIGGLVALLAHAARRGAHLALVARRFSNLALVCWIVMAASGVINAATRIAPSALVSTNYGLLILIKSAALVVLGVVGYRQRSRAVDAVTRDGSVASLLRMGSIEVLVMLTTVAAAVALGRTPPPGGEAGVASRTEELIGYTLNGPPTLAKLALGWRFDLIYGVLAAVAAALYLLAVRRLCQRSGAWPGVRTLSWLAGCATVMLATSSGIGRYMPALPSVQMGGWLLLAVVAPALLMAAAPLRLLQRTLRSDDATAPGPREWARNIRNTALVRRLANPLIAAAVLSVLFSVVYFSGWLETAIYEFWLQPVLRGGFLLFGCVLFWSALGLDPVPAAASRASRVLALVGVGAFLVGLGNFLTQSDRAIGEPYYRGLGLPWLRDVLAHQHLAGGFAIAAAAVPVVVAAAVWWRSRSQGTR
ncbi:cytochrome c oxidase assembly protein [Saccharopolyspora sp. ID03-671]|uniref:bifunctional copper resistance protein CopD/cytochrome c oxidase assembly protein n=1 Tax=Saccharopolyspora sp. ID03-671 TaxID=3073066 RepID=UPI003249DF81